LSSFRRQHIRDFFWQSFAEKFANTNDYIIICATFSFQVEKLNTMMENLYPLEKLTERRLLRDQKLASLAKLKKNFA